MPVASPPQWKTAPLNICCPRINAPVLTGRIDGKEWKSAVRLDRFRLTDGSPATRETTLWIGRDDGYLYLAVRCMEPNTKALQRPGSP